MERKEKRKVSFRPLAMWRNNDPYTFLFRRADVEQSRGCIGGHTPLGPRKK